MQLTSARKHIYQNDATLQSENRIDTASIRLARALNRLEEMTQQRVAAASHHATQQQTAEHDRENQLLKEENEKLNTLLLETINRYDALRQISRTVMQRLDESITRIDTLLKQDA